ncbi:TetR/AcrR family transcriptional regulator [Nocardioides sp. LHD-245]|uniref:TetR/AcrR family transcriptional regulator n=1 Tax=Nocardioides sp. LHD-245 TaxID=3051387 RepID=UPI0027DF4C73|nr:TetR/AcrR family transcriptional regulator [Nocardioides sp. LHD-245]
MAARRGRPRDDAARQRIVGAASALFEQRGFVGTTIVDIAAEAGVAVQTIYQAYGSKVGLLGAAHDVALAGDDDPVALAERAWFLALRDAPSPAAAWQEALAALHLGTARVAPLYAAMLAAEADPDVAGLLVAMRAQRAEFSRLLAEQVAACPGGEGLDRARLADVIYAVESVESHALLVTQRGWSVEAWRAWVCDVVLREISAD